MYIWLLAPTLLTFDVFFWWLGVRDDIIFHRCFEYDGWWLTLPIFYLSPWVNWWLNLLTWNASWWYDHCWNPLVCNFPLIILLTGSPFSPSEGWWFLVILVDLFSYGLCSMMLIMSRTILSRIFKFISFRLIGFWELWLFNYPFSFILNFPTPNLMDWHETKWVPSIGVSRTYVQYFSSI